MKSKASIMGICAGALVVCMMLTIAGCDEVTYGRNAIAAANGAIAQAQAEYLADCTANPSLAECRTINDAVKLHTTAVIGMETYCGFELNKPLPDPTAPCVPVKTAAAGLKITVTNLTAIVGQINALVAAHKAKRAAVAFPKCNHPDGHCWEGNTTALHQQPLQLPFPLYYGALALNPTTIALALAGLKALLDSLLKGNAGEVADETIDAVNGAITELSQHQDNAVTFGELESLKLKELWPDPGADPTTPPTPTPTPAV